MVPPYIGNLSNLQYLDLSCQNTKELWVSDLNWLYGLSSLQYLDLACMNLSKVAANNLQVLNKLPALKELYLGLCRLQSFPTSLPFINFTSLSIVDLSINNLNSQIPQWLFNISTLVSLDLSNNDLSGSIPKFPCCNMCNLRSLDLSNNEVSGEIEELIETLSGCNNSILETLDLNSNKLYGDLPESLWKLKYLRDLQLFLDLSNNSLSGEIPSKLWQLLEQLRIIDLSHNKFSEGIPSSICSPPLLYWLRLGGNNLSGELSTSLPNCSHLTVLDLQENRFFGPIPIGRNVFFLSYLVLRGNMLTGHIPEQLCGFPNVKVLDLSYNNISGSIPRCLGNLRSFKFTGIHFESFHRTYDIAFSEHIEVVAKGRLNEYKKIIELLRVIDLSGNNLIGEIPAGITNLSTLVTLNLSSNKLSGRIPEKIGSLKELESLDLSHNHLSGRIPPGMTSLTSLSYLDFTYNNLSGPIPSTNQFGTFNNPSIYEGNPGLCGTPLTNDCSPGHKDEDDKEGEDKDDEDGSEKLWWYASMGLGFNVGFWAVCGTLVIKKSWRRVYFRFIDEMKEKLLVVIAIYLARLRRKDNGQHREEQGDHKSSTMDNQS